jgi:hypothetical protein
MSLCIQKSKYYVLVYWDRDGGKRITEYIGSNKAEAYRRLVEVLEKKVAYWQEKLSEAQKQLEKLK